MSINDETKDIVYSWSDGSGLEQRAKRDYRTLKVNVQFASNDEWRFSDNNELKSSLRLIEKYAKRINKIFIVTDNQVQSWLNTNHLLRSNNL